MTSVLSTLNPLFEKNQTLTKSIYTSFNRSTREGVKKDSANSLVNTDETESLHYNNDNLVFDSTSGPSTVIISSEGNIIAKGNLTIGGVFNGTCSLATNAVNADHAKSATNADNATNADHATNADNATNAINATNATKATDADHATKADDADYAIRAGDADYAMKATKANNAINAEIADIAVLANNITDDVKANLQTRFDTRYLQSVPDPLTLANCKVTDQMVAQTITVNGKLYAENTIEGNAQTATIADTAKALTDDGKTALQTEFDTRYLQQDILNNYNPVKVSSFEQTYNDIGTITTTLDAQKVVSIASFTVVGFNLPSDCKNVLGYLETYTLRLEVIPVGDSYVETVVGKKDGSQGIVSLFLVVDDGFKPIPLPHVVSSITTGNSSTSQAKVTIFGQGSRFTTTMTDSRTISIKYYSANYTKYNMKWTPTVYLNRILFYQSK